MTAQSKRLDVIRGSHNVFSVCSCCFFQQNHQKTPSNFFIWLILNNTRNGIGAWAMLMQPYKHYARFGQQFFVSFRLNDIGISFGDFSVNIEKKQQQQHRREPNDVLNIECALTCTGWQDRVRALISDAKHR